MDNHFLVTGGAGFIGSHIVEFLVNNGAKSVSVLDDLSTGTLKNIESVSDRVRFIKGTIEDHSVCMEACEGIDIVCHQAAYVTVPGSMNDPITNNSINVNGFVNMVMAAQECGVKRFVYASSSSIYGDSKESRKVESKVGNQLSPYATSKRINELYANTFSVMYDMKFIGLRYFNVFGPRQTSSGWYPDSWNPCVIPTFINAILNDKIATIHGDGSFSRDFVYVDDIVQANVKAMLTTKKEALNQIYNVGVGTSTSILDLYNTIKDVVKSKLEPQFGPTRDGGIPHTLSSISKSRRLLGFEPETSPNKVIVSLPVKYPTIPWSPQL